MFDLDKTHAEKRKVEREPLGVMPRWIHEAERLAEIDEAIQRYIEANKEIPIKWIEERNAMIGGRL